MISQERPTSGHVVFIEKRSSRIVNCDDVAMTMTLVNNLLKLIAIAIWKLSIVERQIGLDLSKFGYGIATNRSDWEGQIENSRKVRNMEGHLADWAMVFICPSHYSVLSFHTSIVDDYMRFVKRKM